MFVCFNQLVLTATKTENNKFIGEKEEQNVMQKRISRITKKVDTYKR